MKKILLLLVHFNKITVGAKELVLRPSGFRFIADKTVALVNVSEPNLSIPAVNMVHLECSSVGVATVNTLSTKEAQNKETPLIAGPLPSGVSKITLTVSRVRAFLTSLREHRIFLAPSSLPKTVPFLTIHKDTISHVWL